tara:strand:+ start:24823 stop:26049 length:1227 start_codon:yes stop_codon:yes gene_type:complete
MKILFISQYFYPEQFSNNSLALELVQREHRVTVIPSVPNYPSGTFFPGYSNKSCRTEVWKNIKIHRARTISRGNHPFRLILNYVTYPITAFIVILNLKPDNYDVSFTSMPSPLTQSIPSIIIKWLYGTPSVYWVQDIWPDSAIHILGINNRLITKVLNRVCGWMYRRADILLIQSEAFRSKMEGFGVDPQRIRFLPNTAPNIYRPIAKKEVSSDIQDLIDDSKFNVMFAGNIGEAQDISNIIAAAEILRACDDICFIFLGSGRYQEKAQAQVDIAKLGKQVKFLGRYDESQMPSFFALADVMLVTLQDNPVFRLTVPYKIQCYMACGRPIIASLNGEGADVVRRSRSGISVAAENPAVLADAILEMRNMDSKGRKEMGKNARSYYKQYYSNKAVYDILENALQDTVLN